MNPFNFVFKLIVIGSGLLCAGSLVEVVVDLERKAAHDTKVGIISIGDFNRQLYGEPPREKKCIRPITNRLQKVHRGIQNFSLTSMTV